MNFFSQGHCKLIYYEIKSSSKRSPVLLPKAGFTDKSYLSAETFFHFLFLHLRSLKKICIGYFGAKIRVIDKSRLKVSDCFVKFNSDVTVKSFIVLSLCFSNFSHLAMPISFVRNIMHIAAKPDESSNAVSLKDM